MATNKEKQLTAELAKLHGEYDNLYKYLENLRTEFERVQPYEKRYDTLLHQLDLANQNLYETNDRLHKVTNENRELRREVLRAHSDGFIEGAKDAMQRRMNFYDATPGA